MTIEDGKTGVDGDGTGNGAAPDGAADQAGKMVPLSALEAERKARQKLELKLAEVSGTVEGLKAGQQKPPKAEKTYTRAELRALVNDGKITEDDMDATLERQLRAEITGSVESTVDARVKNSERSNKIASKIQDYVTAFPAINEEGSKLRARVQAEFDELVQMGDPADALATELKAIKAACGPLNTNGRRAGPDVHEDTGAGGDGGERPNRDSWAKGLSAAQKAHYEKLIHSGVYKGTTDPKLLKELSYAKRTH